MLKLYTTVAGKWSDSSALSHHLLSLDRNQTFMMRQWLGQQQKEDQAVIFCAIWVVSQAFHLLISYWTPRNLVHVI